MLVLHLTNLHSFIKIKYKAEQNTLHQKLGNVSITKEYILIFKTNTPSCFDNKAK